MTAQTQPEALATAAIATLTNLGYTWRGGERWTPPLGKAPDFNLLDAKNARIAELHARVQELEAGLKKANAQAEHFEREWYLRGDELEAAQAQRAPLTDAQCIELLRFGNSSIAMVRSIERAHGITQEKQG